MLRKFGSHLRDQWAGFTALFLVLCGGTAWAVDGPLAGQNTVGSEDIIDNEVKSADIADGRIFNLDVADEIITGQKLKDGTVTGSDIDESTLFNDDSLTQGDLAPSSVAASEIAVNSIGNTNLGDDSVRSAEIATGSVGASEISANAVGPAQIVDTGVRAPEIADNAVGAPELGDNSVDSDAVQADILRASDLAPNSVFGSELGINAVGSSELDAVTVVHTVGFVGKGQFRERTMTCPTGSIAIGGGGTSSSDNPDLRLVGSSPSNSDGSDLNTGDTFASWTLRYKHENGFDTDLGENTHDYVICLA